ncbi:uncharacterized protein LOC116164418 isoform X1 [Photinus pyralis]|uniref:uncharacterized protein LOC116164418 isoform X1 n=1 Tax=Photinus pyralis TaxID=7054 RepID=UPI001266F255|nr:uncharacterized protein LOC116164418 isoform X1 [Photinus pyralis]
MKDNNDNNTLGELYKLANEIRDGLFLGSIPYNTNNIDSNSNGTISKKNKLNQSRTQKLFKFENPTCFTCNGYFGPCFEDPTCATCHAFLYPALPPEGMQITAFAEASDDSDSGNDEPTDVTYRHNVLEFHSLNQADRPTSTPPVDFERLDRELNRISVIQHTIDINIEQLPPEVLIIVFQYLDEISLWTVGQVCSRWREILHMHIRPEIWRVLTLQRWPLLCIPTIDIDWYNMYTKLMLNCCCIKCVKQMAAQEHCSNIEESSWRKHRLRTELRSMRMDPLDGIQAKPLDIACYHWQAAIQGPIGSPYEGGNFFLYIQIPYSYPMKPPIVRFLTKIFHPNISRHGDIGIDAIHHNWSLALTINKVLLSIQSLLTDPYCVVSAVCMEPYIGKLYLDNREEYNRQARWWTWRFAMIDLVGK